MFAELWGSLRGWLSAGINAIASPIQKSPMPAFISPQEVSDYLQLHCRFIPDTLDYSLHPNRLQWIMNNQAWSGVTCDCDDWAIYAYSALHFIPQTTPFLITVSGDDLHMVCGYYRLSGDRVEYGLIDVNGHHTLSNLSSREILACMNKVYEPSGIKFIKSFSNLYPF